jgi:hypothetical protein
MKSLLVLTIVGSFVLSSMSIPPLKDGTQVGRFQLQATNRYDVTGQKMKPELFRIDTATGETWRLGIVDMWETIMER